MLRIGMQSKSDTFIGKLRGSKSSFMQPLSQQRHVPAVHPYTVYKNYGHHSYIACLNILTSKASDKMDGVACLGD